MAISQSLLSSVDVSDVQAHFDASRFIRAYEETRPLWDDPALAHHLDSTQLVLAARLASYLGNGQVARWLLRIGLEKYPTDEAVDLYAFYHGVRTEHPVEVLRACDVRHEQATYQNPMHQSNWLLSMAIHWATYRDLARAYELLEAAESLQGSPAFASTARASILLIEDRWEEAIEAAERAWALGPGRPSSASVLGRVFSRAGRVEEVAGRLLESAATGQSYEIALEAIRYALCMAENHYGTGDPTWLDRAHALSLELPRLAPLADRYTRRTLDYVRFDVAHLREDNDTLRELAEKATAPYLRKLAGDIADASVRGVRVLPIVPLRQKHNTCLPTAAGSIIEGSGQAFDVDALVKAVSHGGTSTWRGVRWLEAQGFVARPLLLTRAVVESLIEGGVPFVFITASLENSHAMTAFGIDRAADCLIVHDPSGLRWSYFGLDTFTDLEAPLGPEGIVIVRPEAWPAVEQRIPSEQFELARLGNEYFRLFETAGANSASKIVTELTQTFPEHAIAQYFQGIHLRNLGQSREAGRILGALLERFPRCERLQGAVASVYASSGDTVRERAVLRDIVEHDKLPGLQLDQEWRRPPVSFVSQYVHLLSRSDDKLPEALRLMRRAVSWNPFSARALMGLGHVLQRMEDLEASVLPIRVAACLELEDDYYARRIMHTFVSLHRQEEGFAFLRERAERLSANARGAEAWCALVGAYEAYGFPERANEVLEAAVRNHPDNEDLLAFAARFWSDMGAWKQARWSIERLHSGQHTLRFLEAGANYALSKGDRAKAWEYGRQWLQEAPLSDDARRLILTLTTMEQGLSAGVELIQGWLKLQPNSEALEQMLFEIYRRQRDEDALDAFVARALAHDPDDAWAWRERGYRLLDQIERTPQENRAALVSDLKKTMHECARTCPEHAVTFIIRARYAASVGKTEKSLELFAQAFERDRSLLVFAADLTESLGRIPREDRKPIFQRLENALCQSAGPVAGTRELILQLAEQFGLAEAEAAIGRWLDRLGDSAPLVEAHGSLLLAYGHGQPDLKRALEVLASGVERFPASFSLQYLLGRCHAALGDDANEELTLQRLAKRSPADLQPHFRLARILENRGESERALAMLERCVELNPASSEARERHANFLWEHGEAEACTAALEKALQFAPESVRLREILADCYMRSDKEHESLRVLREGLNKTPRSAYLWALYGSFLERSSRQADHQEIERVYRKALSLDATLTDASDPLAVLLCRLERYPEAMEVLRAQQPLLSSDYSVRGRMAWIRYEQGEHKGAIEDMERILEAEPRYAWGWRVLIEWLETNKKLDHAQHLLPRIHEAFPEDPDLRAHALETLARMEPGVDRYRSDWTTLLDDFPQHAPLYMARFDVLYERENYADARKVLEHLLQTAPNSPYVRAREVQVCVAEGKREQAVAAARMVWTNAPAESDWPEDTSWRTLYNAGMGEWAAHEAWEALNANVKIGPVAFSWLCGYIKHDYADFWKSLRFSGSACHPVASMWIPAKPARTLLKLLSLLDEVSWNADDYRVMVLDTLEKLGYAHLVYHWYKKNRTKADEAPLVWEMAGIALESSGASKKRVARHFESWRGRPGLHLRSAALYVHALSKIRARNSEQKARLKHLWEHSQTALDTLKHDEYSARYMASVLGATLLQLERWDEFLACMDRYGHYIRNYRDSMKALDFSMRHVPGILETFHSLLTLPEADAYRIENLADVLQPYIIRGKNSTWVSPAWHRCVAVRYPGVQFDRRLSWWIRSRIY